jgi:excisionase family DNA binding protein
MTESFIRQFKGGGMVRKEGWLRPEKVAQYLDCTRQHVYDLVAQGQLEAMRVGRRAMRISEVSLEGFMEKMKIKPLEADL